MMLYTATTFLAIISNIFASRMIVTRKPISLVNYCPPERLQRCPKLPSYQNCVKWYTPEGQCCPICDCKNEHGEPFGNGKSFLTHKTTNCHSCMCRIKRGHLQATCHKQYCMPLECPPPFQEKVEGSCCKRCSPRWVKPAPTFPPFPGNGGFPPGNGGFPPRNGGFPPRNGGFPPRNGGFPPRNGGFPPRNGGFPPPVGDEELENAATAEKSTARKEDQ